MRYVAIRGFLRSCRVQGEQKVNRYYHNRIAGKMVTAAIKSETKNRKGREVPNFPSLRPLLLIWRDQNPDKVFVFGTRSDIPDSHWLEYGKKAWKRAGLNCNTCDGCVKHGQCEHFYQHKFRHTYAHRCLDAGIRLHKLSKWMGHHSIEVTAIYLSGGSSAADRDPFASGLVSGLC